MNTFCIYYTLLDIKESKRQPNSLKNNILLFLIFMCAEM